MINQAAFIPCLNIFPVNFRGDSDKLAGDAGPEGTGLTKKGIILHTRD